MKILITNPPWVFGSVRAGSRWAHESDVEDTGLYTQFPAFLAYATAMIHKEKKHQIKVIDSLALRQTRNEFLSEVKKFKPEILVIETSTASLKNDLDIAKQVKSLTNCKVIFMGPHVIARPEDALNNGVDFCINGEYEYPLKELIKALDKNKLPKKGISYKKNNKIITLPRHAPIEDIDKIPIPAYELFPMEKYSTPFSGIAPNAEVMTARGCPFRCIYCVWPQVLYDTRKIRYRNPKLVVDEIEILLNKYGKKGVYFNDDTFTLNKKHVLGICKEIKKRKLNIKWACFGHVLTVYNMPEILKPMKDAGCSLIKFGIESGSQKMLDNMGKGTTLDIIKKAIKLTKKAGIEAHGSFVFGLPGETLASAKQTIKLAKELELHSLVFSIATPYPGTEYYNRVKEKGWLTTQDWSKYNGECSAVARTQELSTKDITRIFEYADANYVASLIKNPKYVLPFLKNVYSQDGMYGLTKFMAQRIPWYIRKTIKNFEGKISSK